MIERPYRNYPDLSEEKLAERSASYRQLHALRKFIDDKMMYYEQALIDQCPSLVLLRNNGVERASGKATPRGDPLGNPLSK
ncbi:hypothetical protein E2562_012179 [Oryza meyeriana var. granulata]|uniref:Uncharacterized protein n=1 Tax=Oryza meyeriana var. granulata TaxID=110450 RepID=A0A6G1F7F7_9ORYZ|nr:hypothetical protein E2562_012179 [Oryza meyeriana var. granulata]